MANIGYSTITIMPSLKGFSSSVNSQIGSSMDEAGRSSGQSFGGSFASSLLGFVGAGAILGIGQKVGGLIGNGIKSGLATASFMEQANISFETLLGSGGAAEQMLSNLSKFAAATPFDLPGLVDNARELIGSGTAAADVIPTMTALGDTAGALGLSQDRLNQVMLAYTQIQSRGTVQSGDLLQITTAGIPVWQILSQALGKPVSALQDMAQKGQLLSSDVLPALTGQMEKDYGGAMAKQGQTLAGVWSTVQDTLNQAMANALMPLEPILTKILPPAAAFLANAITGISNAAVAMAPPVVSTISTLVGSFGQLWSLLTTGEFDANSTIFGPTIEGLILGFHDTLAGVMPILEEIGPAFLTGFGDASSSLGPLISQLPTVLSIFNPLGLIFRAITPLLPQLAGLIGQLANTVIGLLVPAFNLVVPVVQDVVQLLANVFAAAMPGVVAIVQIFQQVIATLTPVISSLVNALTPLVGAIITQLTPILTNLVQTVMPMVIQILNAVVPPVMQIVTALVGFLIPVINELLPVVTAVFTAVGAVITAALQIVQGVIDVVLGVLTGNWDQAWNGILEILSGVWNLVVSVLQGALNIVLSLFGTSIDQLSSGWNSFWGGIAGFVSDAWNNVTNAVSQGVSNVVGFITGLPNQILNAVVSFDTMLVNAGENLIQGLIGGIKDAATGLANAVLAPVKDAVNGVKSFLGIQSPSKLFHEIGAFTMQGMANGLTDNAGLITDASSALIPAAPSVTSPSVSAGGLAGALAAATGSQGAPIYVQNPFTGEYLLAQVDGRVDDKIDGVSRNVKRGYFGA